MANRRGLSRESQLFVVSWFFVRCFRRPPDNLRMQHAAPLSSRILYAPSKKSAPEYKRILAVEASPGLTLPVGSFSVIPSRTFPLPPLQVLAVARHADARAK